MNKPVYLGLSIFNLSKTEKYELWYDYVKAKYGEGEKLCYMDTDSFIVHVKTDDIYKDIAESIKTYAYGMNKNLVCKKEEIKRNNIIKQYKNI